MRTINQYIRAEGFWFASNNEVLAEAEANPDITPLNPVLERLNLPKVGEGFFVPKYFEQFHRVEDLPVWLWRRLRLEYRPLQIEDYCLWKASDGIYVLVIVKNIHKEQCEICMLGTGDCQWVPSSQIRKIND